MNPLCSLLVSLALAGAAPPAAAEQAQAPNERLFFLEPLKAGGLDPAVAEILPGLLAAALESGGVREQTLVKSAAGCRIGLEVSGKRPWRLSASAERTTGTRAGPSFWERATFTDREALTSVIDEIAIRLDGFCAEAGRERGATGRTLPLKQAYSPATAAMDAYVRARQAIRSGQASQAWDQLDKALAADPAFQIARAERLFTNLTSEQTPGSGGLPAEPAARGATGAPTLGARAAGVLANLLTAGAAESLREAESLRHDQPEATWGRIARAITLSRLGRHSDAIEEWAAAGAAWPWDPRIQMWLGLARMATGDLDAAAIALGRAREGWPELLRAYALQAETQARRRETQEAREILTQMKSVMEAKGIRPTEDDLNPDLMLGSVELLEGHFLTALRQFEKELAALTQAGISGRPTYTLLATLVEMRRDLVTGSDPVARKLQLDKVHDDLERYKSALAPEDAEDHRWEIMRLTGLLDLRGGSTADAWKMIAEMKAETGTPSYSEYHEAYLTAATLLKEGDLEGCAAQFQRAAKARGKIVDLLDVAQTQYSLSHNDAARDAYVMIEQRLARFDPSPGSDLVEMILTDPHLAALVPMYHYGRAQLSFDMGNVEDSRRHFSYMLKYLKDPDESLQPLVREARDRGATPE